jgi:hypothetical protein
VLRGVEEACSPVARERREFDLKIASARDKQPAIEAQGLRRPRTRVVSRSNASPRRTSETMSARRGPPMTAPVGEVISVRIFEDECRQALSKLE